MTKPTTIKNAGIYSIIPGEALIIILDNETVLYNRCVFNEVTIILGHGVKDVFSYCNFINCYITAADYGQSMDDAKKALAGYNVVSGGGTFNGCEHDELTTED